MCTPFLSCSCVVSQPKHVSEPKVVTSLQVGKEWDEKRQKVVKLGVKQVLENDPFLASSILSAPDWQIYVLQGGVWSRAFHCAPRQWRRPKLGRK